MSGRPSQRIVQFLVPFSHLLSGFHRQGRFRNLGLVPEPVPVGLFIPHSPSLPRGGIPIPACEFSQRAHLQSFSARLHTPAPAWCAASGDALLCECDMTRSDNSESPRIGSVMFFLHAGQMAASNSLQHQGQWRFMLPPPGPRAPVSDSRPRVVARCDRTLPCCLRLPAVEGEVQWFQV